MLVRRLGPRAAGGIPGWWIPQRLEAGARRRAGAQSPGSPSAAAGLARLGAANRASTDSTADVAHEFGDQVSYRSFPEFLMRQGLRTAMLDDLRAKHTVTWAGVADTDEFFWSETAPGMVDLLRDVPRD